MFYCYKTKDGEVHTRSFRIGKAPRQIFVNGKKALRSLEAERQGTQSREGWKKPLECFGSGVHADQADDLRKFLAKKGVPTEVTKDGNPLYRSSAHRRAALKARGMHDRNSYS